LTDPIDGRGAGDAAAPHRVSVIVPHYRDLRRLDLCLSALERQTYPRAAFEVIVADNASPEGEAAVATVAGDRAKVVTVPERGAGAARNGGVAVSKGNILAFTDCDCVPEPDWLAEGLAALADYDFVGGRMCVLTDDPTHITGAEAFEKVFAFNNRRYVLEKQFTVTANLLCSRAVFDRVGGFRVGLSEDMEWCQRAIAGGYRIGYAERAVVGHPARRDWAELKTKLVRIDAEMFAFTMLGAHGRLRWLARTLALPVSALAHTPKAVLSCELTSLPQRAGAVAILYRSRLWRFVDALRLMASKR
jgi:glycosyltransferase involved in cell wall biosynthesis